MHRFSSTSFVSVQQINLQSLWHCLFKPNRLIIFAILNSCNVYLTDEKNSIAAQDPSDFDFLFKHIKRLEADEKSQKNLIRNLKLVGLAQLKYNS